MFSILTKPIDKRDIFMTKIKRPFEGLKIVKNWQILKRPLEWVIIKKYLKKKQGGRK